MAGERKNVEKTHDTRTTFSFSPVLQEEQSRRMAGWLKLRRKSVFWLGGDRWSKCSDDDGIGRRESGNSHQMNRRVVTERGGKTGKSDRSSWDRENWAKSPKFPHF